MKVTGLDRLERGAAFSPSPLRSHAPIELRLKKVCYKVYLCVNCQRQSCRAFISLTIRIGGGSSRSRRHQAAAASHIHTDSSQSYLQWRRRLWKITVNELLQFKTKFVSFIAKRQNKSCCWFHSFTLFTGTILC